MTDPGVSRRAVLTAAGWDEPLAIEDQAPVEPAAGQVRVRVQACGVCGRDLIDRAGRFPFLKLPVVPGHEVAGVVEAVGPGDSPWSVGDRVATLHRDHCGRCGACERGDTSLCEGAAWVFGLMADGGYASTVVAPAHALYALPADVDALPAADAAVLHCTFGTAWRSLVTVGRLQAGEKVVITGANGGVGAAAVQVAARRGAEVVAVVRRQGFEPFLEALGAAAVVVSPDNRFHRDPKAVGADVVLECVGPSTFRASMGCLRLGGRLLVVGNVDGGRAEINLGAVVVRGLTILGAGGATPADMQELLDEHARTPWTVPIEEIVPLQDAELAQRRVRAGGLRGRLVLTP